MSRWNQVLKAQRKRLGLSVRDLEKATGFSGSFIRWYEGQANNPTINTLVRYCRVLQLQVYVDGHGAQVLAGNELVRIQVRS